MKNYIIESIYDFYNENEYHKDVDKYGLDEYGAIDMRVMAIPNGDYYDVIIQTSDTEEKFEMTGIANAVERFVFKHF